MVSPHAALEGVQTKAGDIHALRAGTSIECGEDAQEPRGVPTGQLSTTDLARGAPADRDAGTT